MIDVAQTRGKLAQQIQTTPIRSIHTDWESRNILRNAPQLRFIRIMTIDHFIVSNKFMDLLEEEKKTTPTKYWGLFLRPKWCNSWIVRDISNSSTANINMSQIKLDRFSLQDICPSTLSTLKSHAIKWELSSHWKTRCFEWISIFFVSAIVWDLLKMKSTFKRNDKNICIDGTWMKYKIDDADEETFMLKANFGCCCWIFGRHHIKNSKHTLKQF